MANLFELAGRVVLDTQGAEKDLQQFESRTGRTAKGVSKNVGKMGLAFGGVAVAAGAGLLKIGSQMHNATNIIRNGTGASGEALEGLRNDFKAVAKEVPQSLDVVASATADLNTELALEGKQLQDASKIALDYARVHDTDVGGAIKGVSDAMGIFNVPAEEFAGTLDKLTVVSQATGVSVDKLTSQAQSFGPIWSTMGFEMDEAVAIMGNMEAKGIDVSRVMPGLNSATKKWTSEGVTDLRGELEGTVEQIQNTEDSGERLAIAQEAFGTSGARMLGFIEQEGFALEDLDAIMAGSEGTVESLGRENLTLGERFSILKNRITVALDPIARRVHDLAIVFMDVLVPAILSFVSAVQDKLEAPMQRARKQLHEWYDVIQKEVIPAVQELAREFRQRLAEPIDRIIALFKENESMAKAMGVALGAVLVTAVVGLTVAMGALVVSAIAVAAPFIAIVAAVGLVSAGIFLLTRHWDSVTERFPQLQRAADIAVRAFEGIRTAAELLARAVTTHWNSILRISTVVFTGIVSIAGAQLNALLGVIEGYFKIIEGVFNVFAGLFTGDWRRMWDGIKQIFEGFAKITISLIKGFFDTFRAYANTVLGVFDTDWRSTWDGIIAFMRSIKNFFTVTIPGWFAQLAQDVLGTIGSMATSVIQFHFDLRDGIVRAIERFINTTVPNWFSSARDKVTGFATDLKDNVIDAFNTMRRDLIRNFKRFFTSTIPGWFKDGANGIIGWVEKGLNQPIDAFNKLVGGLRSVLDKVAGWIGLSISTDWTEIPSIKLDRFARGTKNAPGGLSLVGEEGPELLNLPPHAGVMPNRDTMSVLEKLAQVKGWDGVGGWGIDTLKDAGKGLISGAAGFVGSGLEELGDVITKPVRAGIDAFQKIAEWGAEKVINAAWSTLIEPLLDKLPSGALGQLMRGVPAFFKDKIIDAIQGALDGIPEGMIDGRAVAQNLPGWFKPANGRFSQGFGRTSSSGSLYSSGVHSGIDIAAGMGSPIFAAQTGIVKSAGWDGGYGIAIRQAVGNLELIYGHLQRALVRAGQIVRGGQQIGLMDSTGYSFGSHLHFETRRFGRAVNPLQFIKAHNGAWDVGANLAPGEMVFPPNAADRLRNLLTTGSTGTGNGQQIVVRIGDETLADLIVRGNTLAERTGRSDVSKH